MKRKINGVVRDEIGEVLSIDPRDQSARVRWLRQNRVGQYKLSELTRLGSKAASATGSGGDPG